MRLAKCLSTVLGLVGVALSQANYDDVDNYWIVPSASTNVAGEYSRNEVYSVGTQLTLKWKSNFTRVLIRINQDLAVGNTYSDITSNIANTGSLNWTVQVPTGLSLSEVPVFWFSFWNAGQGSGNYHLSHYFNITTESVSTSSSSVTSGNMPSAATSSSSSASSAVSTVQTSTGGGGGLSSGAKIGIGVGVSLGVLCLALISVIIWLFARRRSKTASQSHSTMPSLTSTAVQQTVRYHEVPGFAVKPQDQFPHQKFEAYEMHGQPYSDELSRHELPEKRL